MKKQLANTKYTFSIKDLPERRKLALKKKYKTKKFINPKIKNKTQPASSRQQFSYFKKAPLILAGVN